ncbi:MAG: hypothetical protein FIB01_07730 [Gemmatimonadetes bacterium]|nr:hypothetical protein [Gemmatimonadota bacterium]
MSTPTVPGPTPAEAPDPLVGPLFAARYRIIRKLGEGAMGAVYVGEHQHIGRRDAIKVLRPGLAGDEEAIRRFTRGTRNVSAIRHPNVCIVYDFSDTPEGIRYLAMEYIEGDTLKEILDREGRMALPRAVELTRQVAEALQAAHEAGVVHRDLKPGNIMICRRPDGREQVKVVDFDIAKGPAEAQGEEVTRVGFVVGTPEYMSPEQLTGERLDGRSDLYSLGVVLFRMLTGQLPFRAASTQEIMIQRLTVEPLRLPDVAPDLVVPPALEHALQRALARRAQDRQASAGEFAEELVAAMSGAAMPAPAPGTARPRDAAELAPTRVAQSMPAPGAAPARKRSPVLMAGLAVVVLAAVGGGAYYFKGRSAAPADRTGPDSAAPSAVLNQGGSGAVAPPAGTALQEDTAGRTGTPQSGGQPAATEGAGAADPQQLTTPQTPSRTVANPPRTQAQPAGGGSPLPAGGVSAMLNRQMDAVFGASGAQLRAVRDSAQLGWRLAGNRADSAAAALLLAQAAFAAGDNGECLRWARQAAGLGAAGAQTLVQECQ